MNIIYTNSHINNKRQNQKPSDENIIIKQKSNTHNQKQIPSDQNIIIKQKSKHISKHKPIDELKFQQNYTIIHFLAFVFVLILKIYRAIISYAAQSSMYSYIN